MYKIKNITEDWGKCTASIVLENVETNDVQTYECTIDTINRIANELGYDVDDADDIMTEWMKDKEINMLLMPVDVVDGQIILPN